MCPRDAAFRNRAWRRAPGGLGRAGLADAGYTITLIDEASTCLQRASLKNEGKIHLGFVYAHDASERTAPLMLESALAFGPLLEGWVGRPLPWHELTACPFSYLILDDSLVPAAELLDAWEKMQGTYDGMAGKQPSMYLGERVSRLWWRPAGSDRARPMFSARVSMVVETIERAVNPDRLNAIVRERLHAHDRVCCRYQYRVRTVQRTPNGFKVEGTSQRAGTWTAEAPVVVNCLWDGRLAIDREMGVLPKRPWVYRLKYRLLAELPERLIALPSVTMMLGRFGDLVNYGNGRVYLSWYPTCLGGWSSDVMTPDAWRQACRNGVPTEDSRELIERTLEAFDRIVPGLRDCRVDSVAAGVRTALGWPRERPSARTRSAALRPLRSSRRIRGADM